MLAWAIRCVLLHWSGLVLILEDGRIELKINTVERAIRPIALERKHTPFAAQRVGLASELAPLLPWNRKIERLSAAIHA